MFEFLQDDDTSAIAVLKNDHDELKDLFDQFEDSDSRREKVKIARRAIEIIKAHAEMEEKIFYPAARAVVDVEYMDEADEEHHVAKILVAELDGMQGNEDHFDAKFKVLAESLRHHIKEEEGNIFSEAKGSSLDLDAIGESMLALRRRLLKEGVPPSAEEKMVRRGKTATNTRMTAAKVTKKKAKKAGSRRLNGRADYLRTGAPL